MSTSTLTPSSTTAPDARRTGRISAAAGLRHGFTITWRNLMRIKRSPESLLDLTLQPIIFIVLFVYHAVTGSRTLR